MKVRPGAAQYQALKAPRLRTLVPFPMTSRSFVQDPPTAGGGDAWLDEGPIEAGVGLIDCGVEKRLPQCLRHGLAVAEREGGEPLSSRILDSTR